MTTKQTRRLLLRDFRRLAISLGWFFAAALIAVLALLGLGRPAQGLSAATLVCAGLSAGAIAVVNFALLPVLLWLRVPMVVFSAGLITFAVNAALLLIAHQLIRGAAVPAPDWLFSGALAISLINTLINGLIALDDDYTYLRFIIQATRDNAVRFGRPKDPQRRGVVILEIDGLSYERMKAALESGLMPTTRELLKGSHCLSRFDCGLPSQTSSAQAGIMYGDNEDIPAFRWYDKRRDKLWISNRPSDAHALNQRHSNGRGLLRQGTSINNLINGDAARSLLTLSAIARPNTLPTERALDVLIAFWLNPYTFARTLALCAADLLLEIAQALRQRIRHTQPRLEKRFPSAYTGLRVITNVLLRDLAIYATMWEITRGAPVIYTSFLGYDEVAHHAGPCSPDAMGTLKGFDRHVRHVLQTIRHLAPFEYDVILLSDHGQSHGATFRQRYGQTLRQVIDGLTRDGVRVSEATIVDVGHSFVQALIAELNAASRRLWEHNGQRLRRATMAAATRTLAGMEQHVPQQPRRAGERADIVVCISGNLAHVYFSAIGDRRATLGEIAAHHPGLVEALAEHPGIGFVIGLGDDGHVLLLGKQGARDLSDGAVTGQDPLLPFAGDALALRAGQLLRLAQFESAGDLILNSALYPDGSIASFEELVGSHGGLGGEQTHAFILHPCARPLDHQQITNATALYHVLEAWARPLDKRTERATLHPVRRMSNGHRQSDEETSDQEANEQEDQQQVNAGQEDRDQESHNQAPDDSSAQAGGPPAREHTGAGGRPRARAGWMSKHSHS